MAHLLPAAGLFCLPQGVRLPRASLFFASPKKSKQKKGEPKAVPLRGALRYSRRPGSGANSLRSNSVRPDPRAAALLSMANGSGGPRVLVRCAHLAHACWRVARAIAVAPATATKTIAVPTAAAAPSPNPPSPNPLTTTASFPNRGQQTRTASSRTNTRIRPKKTKLAVPAPLHPGGGEGAGGKRGTKSGGQDNGGQAQPRRKIVW